MRDAEVDSGSVDGEISPLPWAPDLAVPIKAGDYRVRLNGRPPSRDCRILSEANYQYAIAAVNAHAEREAELARLRAALANAEGARQQGWNKAHRLRRELRAANERADGLARACDRLLDFATSTRRGLLVSMDYTGSVLEGIRTALAAARQPAPPAPSPGNPSIAVICDAVPVEPPGGVECPRCEGHGAVDLGDREFLCPMCVGMGRIEADIHDHRAEFCPHQPDAGLGSDALDMATGQGRR